MLKDDLSDSDTQENDSNSSSEELETPIKGGTQKMSEYEKQRMKRIEENRARMEALGLTKMASSLMGSVQKTKKKSEAKAKAKAKVVEEDEEYKPSEGENGLSSCSEEDEVDEEFVGGGDYSGSGTGKFKKKYSAHKKKVSLQKLMNNSKFVDDDEALMQAIALSLKDSADCSDVGRGGLSQSSDANLTGVMINDRKGNSNIQEDKGKRKRKKLVNSRVQMTEDELLVHFFQFDEGGKGTITLRDIRRLAAAHDFLWTDKEMADMIYCFDSDGDGKLSLDDFRTIAGRCNMIQRSENARQV